MSLPSRASWSCCDSPDPVLSGTPDLHGQPVGGPRGSSELLGVVANGFVLAVTAEALAITGLLWMVRIWRGPTRDAPPDWRYRE